MILLNSLHDGDEDDDDDNDDDDDEDDDSIDDDNQLQDANAQHVGESDSRNTELRNKRVIDRKVSLLHVGYIYEIFDNKLVFCAFR